MATFDPEQLSKALKNVPRAFLKEFDPRMRAYMRSFAQGTMAKRISGRPGLFNRTGAAGLRGSFGTAFLDTDKLDTWQGMVFTTSKYARIHEKGGTITPKGAQFLTIPLPAARTAAGVTRGGARSFPNTFFATSKAGNRLMFQKVGDRIVPLFVLKKSVTIPARLGMFAAWASEDDARKKVLAKSAKLALDGMGAV